MVGIITSFSLKGQCDIRMYDIYTPIGSAVVTFLMCESSTSTRAYWDNYIAQVYPNAVQIPTYNGYSSTRKFNCHGYAWLRVEQGIDRWIGTGWSNDIYEPEWIYVTDGSYINVSQETFPGKVFWASGDHTAITTEQQGWFISKWNEYPLLKHRWNDSPYGTTNLKYYVKNCSVSGNQTVNFTNQPSVTSNTNVKSCGGINVQNVEVKSGATLILDAETTTKIPGGFKIEAGAGLKIQ